MEVQKIIYLQKLANQLPDTFADPNRVTKSYIPACNAPIRIDVQKGQCQVATESKQRLKRGRPIGCKYKQPRKSKRGAGSESIKETVQDIYGPAEPTRMVEPCGPAPVDPAAPHSEVRDAGLHGMPGPDNQEISINYMMS